jgi:hypothetical protein
LLLVLYHSKRNKENFPTSSRKRQPTKVVSTNKKGS